MTTREEFLAIRASRIDLEMDVMKRLDSTGVNGFEVIIALKDKQFEEHKAFAAMPHEERAAVIRDDNARMSALLARGAETARGDNPEGSSPRTEQGEVLGDASLSRS